MDGRISFCFPTRSLLPQRLRVPLAVAQLAVQSQCSLRLLPLLSGA